MAPTVEQSVNATGLAPVTVPVPLFTPAEPAVFAKKRAAARAALATTTVPSDKKYTNWLRMKVAERFEGRAIGGAAPEFTIDQPDYDTGIKTIAIPLAKAIKDWPAEVAPYLMGDVLPPAAHYFSALSGSTYMDGVVVVIPKDTKVAVTADFSAEPGKLNGYRTIIVVNEGANATFLERNKPHRKAKGGTVVSHGVEVYVKPGATFSYYGLQQWPEDVSYFPAYRAVVEAGASMDWLIGSFGASLSQPWIESALAGEGAETNVRAVYYGTDAQHLDQTLTANHLVGHTSSDTYARGIVTDTAKAVYRGMIKIQRGAHGSSADQNGHGMLLTNTAHIDSIPGLEIDADDVTAGHGATVGQVDDEQLFYLMARGLSRDQARDMIIHGFFEDLFKRITSESIRSEFWRAVEAKRS